MTLQIGHYLVLGGVFFGIGACGFLVRRNALVALMCIELMLNAVNLTLIAFNRFQPSVQMPALGSVPGAAANPAADASAQAAMQTMIPHTGQIFTFFVIAIAAAEAAVGLAIVLSLYRVRKVVRTDDANLLKE